MTSLAREETSAPRSLVLLDQLIGQARMGLNSGALASEGRQSDLQWSPVQWGMAWVLFKAVPPKVAWLVAAIAGGCHHPVLRETLRIRLKICGFFFFFFFCFWS